MTSLKVSCGWAPPNEKSWATPMVEGHNVSGEGLKKKQKKKIRGQEPTFREQTLSRPRTEMVEAKAKDRGHNFF